MRHEEVLAANQRMALQVKNLGRIPNEEKQAIRAQARRITLRLAD